MCTHTEEDTWFAEIYIMTIRTHELEINTIRMLSCLPQKKSFVKAK